MKTFDTTVGELEDKVININFSFLEKQIRELNNTTSQFI
jgi:hypothetical protein